MRAGFIYTRAVIVLAGLLPTYLIRFSIAGIPTNFLEIAILLVAMFGLLQPGIRRQWASAWRALPRRLILLAALFLLASVISTVISSQLRVSLGILKGWIIAPLLLGWLVYTVGSKVLQPLILSGVVIALLGISQLGTVDRVRSIYDVPNSLALFLVPIFVLAVGYRKWWQVGVMGIAILATQSMGAVLAIVGATFMAPNFQFPISNFQKKHKTKIVLFGICVLGFGIYWAPLFRDRLNYLLTPFYDPTQHSSVSVRAQLWDISWQLIREQPLLGIGLGQFEPAYQAVLFTRQGAIPEYVLRDPHNWILSFWLNTGLLGLVSFAGLNGYVLWRCQDKKIADALLALLLFGLVDTIYWKNDLAALQWMLVALGTNAIGGASLAARTSIGLARFAVKL